LSSRLGTLSFAKAAAELHVTPGAISQQIKQLETSLAASFFSPLESCLDADQEGQACLPG